MTLAPLVGVIVTFARAAAPSVTFPEAEAASREPRAASREPGAGSAASGSGRRGGHNLENSAAAREHSRLSLPIRPNPPSPPRQVRVFEVTPALPPSHWTTNPACHAPQPEQTGYAPRVFVELPAYGLFI